MTGTPISCASPIHIEDTEPVKSNFVITNNRFTTLGNAFRLNGVLDVDVRDNVVTFKNGGCTYPGAAIVAANSSGNDVSSNDFTGATRIYPPGASATGTACGNRLTGTAFNQPQACESP
jgi:hypothetical protein